MLFADEARRRCTFVPVGLLTIGLGIGVATGLTALGPQTDLVVTAIMAAFTLLVLGWFVLGVRHARREGDAIVVRSLAGTLRVLVEGSEVMVARGGGHRSPHFDVLLQPATGTALRLARLELYGVGRTPWVARRMAAVLDVRVDEPSVGELEAQLAQAAELRRGAWRFLAGIAVVGVVLSVVMVLVSDHTMATIAIRCPGGQVREGGATMLDGLEMTMDPGARTFELHPANGPAWSQRVELVAGQTTVLDCSAGPRPAATKRQDLQGARVRERQ